MKLKKILKKIEKTSRDGSFSSLMPTVQLKKKDFRKLARHAARGEQFSLRYLAENGEVEITQK